MRISKPAARNDHPTDQRPTGEDLIGEHVIDEYLHRLGRRLHGSVRRRADLLTEARGSLEDAAEAYREGGLDARTAQLRAVAEFGAPEDLAPAYQAELTAGHGRRLALVVILLPVGMLTANLMWWQPPATDAVPPPTLFLLMTRALDWVACLAGVLALVALALLGRMGRRLVLDPRQVVRPLAASALGATGLIWTVGTFAAVTSVLEQPQALTWPPMIIAWIMLNTTFLLLGRAAFHALAGTSPRLARQ